MALIGRLASLEEFPEELRRDADKGFEQFFAFDRSLQKKLFEGVFEGVRTKGSVSTEQVRKSLGGSEVRPQCIFVVMVLVYEFVESTDTPEKFVQRFVGDSLTEDQRRLIIELLQDATKIREELKRGLMDARVAERILPSLEKCTTSLDFRAAYDEDKFLRLVPVIIMSITTDVSRNELRCQFREGDLDDLLKELQSVKKKLSEMKDVLGSHL